MKPTLAMRIGKGRRKRRAFTLHSLMIANVVLIFVIGGVVSATFLGMRMATVAQAEISAADQCRKLRDALRADVLTADVVEIGNGDAVSFTASPPDSPCEGNALILHTEGGGEIRYSFDAGEGNLTRLDQAGRKSVVVSGVAPPVLFQAEDFSGAVLMNLGSATVISVRVACDRLDYPSILIGPGEFCKSFELTARAGLRHKE